MKFLLEGQMKTDVRRVVIKLGTKQITDTKEVNFENLRHLIKDIVWLRFVGVEVVLTVSGAIGMAYTNVRTFGIKNGIPEKQALAAFGQVKLMELLDSEFESVGLKVGQVLLTHYIFDQRNTWLNARNTVLTMLTMDFIPIINENDSVAVDEIKFGDNDRLGAMVSLLIEADLYVILSDIDGFYENYEDENRKLLRVVDSLEDVVHHAGDSAHVFTSGGMKTKLEAVRIALRGGVRAVIANGFKKGVLRRIFEGGEEGTLFVSNEPYVHGKKKWISGRNSKGTLIVDDGAVQALKKHKSLLASGILETKGRYHPGDAVTVLDEKKTSIAIGLINYSSHEVRSILGKQSLEFASLLGVESCPDAVIHIDNMVILEKF